MVNFSEMDAATLTEVLKGSAKDREEEEDVRSFVHVAAANGRQVLLELFLGNEYGRTLVNVHEEGEWGGVPLHSVCASGHLACVSLLLANGAEVDARTLRDLTPLHYACSKGFDAVVRKLISAGADVNAKDAIGNAPIHRAASQGRVSVLKILISEQANIEQRENSGQTPLLVAADGGQDECAILLVMHGANVEAKWREEGIEKGIPDRLKNILETVR